MEIDHCKIDFPALRKQKRTLMTVIQGLDWEEQTDLIGILHLIDFMQDTAVDGGYVEHELVFE